MKKIIVPMAAILLLQACAPASLRPLPATNQSLGQGQAVLLNVEEGTVDISAGEAGTVQITGQVPGSADGFSVQAASDGLHISLKRSARPFWSLHGPAPRLDLRIPAGTRLQITSFAADIGIHDFRGDAAISATSGRIDVLRSQGRYIISSNRGDVTAAESSGEVRIAGNYGLLSLVNTHGRLSASTIMGTVRFTGRLAAGDEASLETDHGPVEIELAAGSDVSVQITTTTGVVACTVPGLRYSGQGCTGSLGAGSARLKVRTVSGGVTLNPQH